MKVTLYDDEPRGMRQRQNVIDLPLVTLVRSDAENGHSLWRNFSFHAVIAQNIAKLPLVYNK